MELTYFENNQKCLEKLIEFKVLSKTSKLAKLEQLKYKKIIDGKVIEHDCKVLAFGLKHCSPKCHDTVYQNLLIEADRRTFNINIDYFASMQKKSFGVDNESTEE